jgi:hypothetical protein
MAEPRLLHSTQIARPADQLATAQLDRMCKTAIGGIDFYVAAAERLLKPRCKLSGVTR